MAHIGKAMQQFFGSGLRSSSDAPAAPFAKMTLGEFDQRFIANGILKFAVGLVIDLLVNMDHHRAVRRSPMARDLFRAPEGCVD